MTDTLLQPFAGLRPAPGRAADVAAPPYDVVSLGEARALADGQRWCFVTVSRPEIDLPEGTADRPSVGSGKRVPARGDRSGRGVIQKRTYHINTCHVLQL